MQDKFLIVGSGLVCFMIGLVLMNWSNLNSTGDEIYQPFQPDTSFTGDSYYSGSYFALGLGFTFLCAGSILVGGVLLGWNVEHILREAWNCCSSLADWIL
ncbi:MAG: hypothetical protein H6677_11840 [Candidatus Obscuribacterales bacterium]|nr:hypothetical protein [Candidatus Obscuribacterales bacterium]